MTKGEFLSYLNKRYGTNILERFKKLNEEFNELKDVMINELNNDDYSHRHCIDFTKRFVDELADVNVILFHIAGIMGTSQSRLLEYAQKKIKGREKDPNFMRYHPHKE